MQNEGGIPYPKVKVQGRKSKVSEGAGSGDFKNALAAVGDAVGVTHSY